MTREGAILKFQGTTTKNTHQISYEIFTEKKGLYSVNFFRQSFYHNLLYIINLLIFKIIILK